MFDYEDLVKRNAGFVSSSSQRRLKDVRVLVAGCGVGSTIAEAAARIGVGRFCLVDGDDIETHNLNRQAFTCQDVGCKKVDALADRILAINPSARVMRVPDWLTEKNVASLVAQADFVLDTIDFLDISSITALHDECQRRRKPVITAMSAAWGALAIYIPHRSGSVAPFRRLFGLPDRGPVNNKSYARYFGPFIEGIKALLDPKLVEVLRKTLPMMEDAKPCPAPHVSPGAYTVAALAVTMMVRVLNEEYVPTAPQMVLVDLAKACIQGGIELPVPSAERTCEVVVR